MQDPFWTSRPLISRCLASLLLAIALASVSVVGGRAQQREVLAMSPAELAEHAHQQYDQMLVDFWPTVGMYGVLVIAFVVIYELLTHWIDRLLTRVMGPRNHLA